MDALTALHNRVSCSLLTTPAPTHDEIQQIVKAGLRACDHHALTPWKFLLIEGERRKAFGELMAKTMKVMREGDLEPDLEQKIQAKPFRAPSIIAVVANTQPHDKVPEIEQLLSAGAAAQMMVTAAHALGLGAIWRSGSLMFHSTMQDGLGLTENQKLVGFLYFGTPKTHREPPAYQVEDFLEVW